MARDLQKAFPLPTQKLFSMRMDTPEGAEFLQALDRLREAEKPMLSRSAMVKKLVFRAAYDRKSRK